MFSNFRQILSTMSEMDSLFKLLMATDNALGTFKNMKVVFSSLYVLDVLRIKTELMLKLLFAVS